jgi:L-malate glycosyltransferase
MKILTITSSYPKNQSSHEGIFIRDLVTAVADSGITSIVLAPHFPRGLLNESSGKVSIHRFRYFFPTGYERLAYGSGLVFALRQSPISFFQIFPFVLVQFFSTSHLLVRKKPDLIHTHWLLPQGLIGAILSAIFKIPHVTTIHGTDLNLVKKNLILKIICRFIIKKSDVVTVNSLYMRQQLLDVEPDIKAKTEIIPMGVNSGRFRTPEISTIKKESGEERLILTIGRLIDWKGTIYLIEALPAILSKFPDTVLVVIGSGPEMGRLQQEVSQLSLGKNVKFLNTISNEDVVSYYHSADVFVLPSVCIDGRTEGLGVVLLEAMASGCPVIGSRVGGIPDIITDGVNGFLVQEKSPEELSEKIIRVLSDAELSEKFRRNGYRTIDKSFSWTTIAKRFIEIYSRAIEHKTNFESGEIR